MLRQKPTRKFRLLVIEDDRKRMAVLRSWIPEYATIVHASSGGMALSILRRDRGSVYGGILLDHDLEQQHKTEADYYLSGTDVMESILQNMSRDVPVFIHSMNLQQGPMMEARLAKAGFSVTQIPMDELSCERPSAWVDEARENWEALEQCI